MTRTHRLRTLLLVPLLALVLAACDGSGVGSGGGTSDPPPTTAAPPAGLDWTAREGRADLGGGYVAEFCEGEAPFVCVSDASGAVVGTLELLRQPADAAGRDPRANVASLIEVLREDRPVGCGEGYAVEPEPPVDAELGEHAGIRYGFVGRDATGAEAERTVGWMAVAGDELLILGAPAAAPGSCMDTDVPIQFRPEVLRQLTPALDAMVAASTVG